MNDIGQKKHASIALLTGTTPSYMAEQGRSLPYHVQKEFDQYFKCGRLAHGFFARTMQYLPP
jgi:hypothetical protein